MLYSILWQFCICGRSFRYVKYLCRHNKKLQLCVHTAMGKHSLSCVCVCVCADDDNRIELAPIPGHEDCQGTFINACYIEVRNDDDDDEVATSAALS